MAGDPPRTDKQNPVLGPAACWQVQSDWDFHGQIASASATPEIANQYPHDPNYGQEYKTGEGDEYTHRVFHRKSAVYRVEAIKAPERRGQRERIILRHLEGVFVRMILRFPGK